MTASAMACSTWARCGVLLMAFVPGCQPWAVLTDGEDGMDPLNHSTLRQAAPCGEAVPWMRCVPGSQIHTLELNVEACDAREGGDSSEWVETFHVTEPIRQLDYLRCVGAGNCSANDQAAVSDTARPLAAVTGLERQQAKAYCAGRGLQLLSPEEWRALDGCEGLNGNPIFRCALSIEANQGLSAATRARMRRAPYAQGYAQNKHRGHLNCSRACRPGGVAWIACDPAYAKAFGQPTPMTEQGFDLSRSYKDVEMVGAILSGYQSKHSDIARLHKLGESRQGRPIWALRVNTNPTLSPFDADDKPALLLNGAHHGDELLTVDYALDALQQVLEGRDTPRVKRWIDQLDLWFVPLVNPDGNYLTLHRDCSYNMGRKNGRDLNGDGRLEIHATVDPNVRDPMSAEGVDLNRNYPFMWAGLPNDRGSKSDPWHSRYRGPPGSNGVPRALEPEAQVMVNLATRMRFVAALSWHTDASKLLSPYTIPGVKNPTPDVAWSVAETLLEAMAENIEHAKLNARNDRELRRYERFRVAKALYKVDGTDQDWHFHAHGTLAYIFEGTHQNPADNAVRLTSIAVQRPLFGALADRVLDSSMIHGVVRDATGDPVAGAVVTIDGYQRGDAGEEWTSRYDGRYTRIALKPGSYTVRAHNGEQAGEARVTVGSTPTKVDIRMSKPHAP